MNIKKEFLPVVQALKKASETCGGTDFIIVTRHPAEGYSVVSIDYNVNRDVYIQDSEIPQHCEELEGVKDGKNEGPYRTEVWKTGCSRTDWRKKK